MGGTTKSSKRDKEKLSKNALANHEFEEAGGQDDFNSLIPDQHVDVEAPKSMKEFNFVRDKVKKKKIMDIRIRGLKVEAEMGKLKICKVEILCASEIGILNALDLLADIKSTHSFCYVRLMGDNHINIGTDKIEVGVQGFTALCQAFTASNTFDMTSTFRFYNFQPDVTPLMSFVQVLQNNPTLQTIGFAKNSLNEDVCAGILQRVYYNPVLKCLDINGNNITISTFKQNYIKPYF